MTDEQRPEEELAYIKYSAKEILFHLTSKVETLQSDVNNIKLNMVTRGELSNARRWAVGAAIAALSALAGMLRLF
jgi:hypothetical protein